MNQATNCQNFKRLHCEALRVKSKVVAKTPPGLGPEGPVIVDDSPAGPSEEGSLMGF